MKYEPRDVTCPRCKAPRRQSCQQVSATEPTTWGNATDVETHRARFAAADERNGLR